VIFIGHYFNDQYKIPDSSFLSIILIKLYTNCNCHHNGCQGNCYVLLLVTVHICGWGLCITSVITQKNYTFDFDKFDWWNSFEIISTCTDSLTADMAKS